MHQLHVLDLTGTRTVKTSHHFGPEPGRSPSSGQPYMKHLTAPIALALGLAASLWLMAASAMAQTSEANLRSQVNEGTVRIVAGPLNSTALTAIADLSVALDGVNGLRIIPIIGKGSIRNVTDLLYLNRTDMAVVQADALEYIKRERVHPAIERRIAYITKLFNEEVHVIANSAFSDLRQLAGQRVAIGTKDSGSFVTAQILFERLGIQIQPVYAEPADALEMIKQSQIAAMVDVGGKPVRLLSKVKAGEGITLLPIPQDQRLLDTYLPARITAEDYPNLLQPGQQVDSIAVGTVLIAFNWRRDTSAYKFLTTFVEAFFSHLPQLHQPPHHPKWQETNLTAQLPGWRRFGGAEDALSTASLPAACTEPVLQAAFRKFMRQYAASNATGTVSASDTEELFQQFIEWLRTNRG